MFCQKCGHEVKVTDKFCPYCGASQENSGYTYFNESNNHPQPTNIRKEDQGNAGFAVLSFFFPIVGLILFLCWRKEKPRTAKQAGIGALISIVFYLVIAIFIGICIALV